MKKWTTTLLSVLLIMTAVLAGCGGNDKGEQGSASPSAGASGTSEQGGSKKNVTLTYMASQGWIKDSEMELAKKFEEQTGIKIDFQIVPSDQYFNVLKTKLNAGEGPDIFGGQSGYSEITMNYNVEKNAVDLSDQEWVKREDPLSVEQLTANGKVYALTIWDTYSSFVIAYNKKLFNELNLEVPKTYAEFKNASLKIQEAGVTPIYQPIADGWHHVLWFSEPGPNYEELEPNLYDDLNQNKKKFVDSKAMLDSLTQLKEMYDLNFFGDNTLSDTGSDTVAKLGSGEFAMSLVAQSAALEIAEEYEEFEIEDIGFFPIPLTDNQIYYINPGGPSKFIYSGSKYIEEAKQYFNFLTEQENLQYMLDNDATISNLNFPDLKNKYTVEQQKMFDSYPKRGTDIQNYVNYVNPQWMDIGKDMVAMLSGVIQPIDVLKSIDQRRAEMAKVAQDPNWK
ncbi:ABC transporter substrate-binding protein [Cohnella phaseoli]|uniref:Carbohydrate ABC transporter substrate-binding protein (CUT1 family) n=1 Tax=Cohnella phaseoli TaxID=456490 RepID=A0A3D9JR18_9BACL|nr:ABC transporter substrate-binding protein [Cohnella phaseoli]RED76415.1 carbohydrate ABC transporter substrate-binding protein (CUT1 family) [Cohnella phaseoli]